MFRYFARDKMGRDQKSFIYFANLQNLKIKKDVFCVEKTLSIWEPMALSNTTTAWLRIFVWSFFFSFHVSCL